MLCWRHKTAIKYIEINIRVCSRYYFVNFHYQKTLNTNAIKRLLQAQIPERVCTKRLANKWPRKNSTLNYWLKKFILISQITRGSVIIFYVYNVFVSILNVLIRHSQWGPGRFNVALDDDTGWQSTDMLSLDLWQFLRRSVVRWKRLSKAHSKIFLFSIQV